MGWGPQSRRALSPTAERSEGGSSVLRRVRTQAQDPGYEVGGSTAGGRTAPSAGRPPATTHYTPLLLKEVNDVVDIGLKFETLELVQGIEEPRSKRKTPSAFITEGPPAPAAPTRRRHSLCNLLQTVRRWERTGVSFESSPLLQKRRHLGPSCLPLHILTRGGSRIYKTVGSSFKYCLPICVPSL